MSFFSRKQWINTGFATINSMLKDKSLFFNFFTSNGLIWFGQGSQCVDSNKFISVRFDSNQNIGSIDKMLPLQLNLRRVSIEKSAIFKMFIVNLLYLFNKGISSLFCLFSRNPTLRPKILHIRLLFNDLLFL